MIGGGHKPIKGNTFLFTFDQLLSFIGDKVGLELDSEEEIEVDGVKVADDTLDLKFQKEYERKLTKLIPCRAARLSTFGVEDDTDYDAL